jgi:hypothetical protein
MSAARRTILFSPRSLRPAPRHLDPNMPSVRSSVVASSLALLSLTSATLTALAGCPAGGDAPARSSAQQEASASDNPASGAGAAGGEATAPAGTPGLPEASTLLEAHVEASGGRDKLAAITSLHVVSSIDMAAINIKATQKLWWAGSKFHVEQVVEGFGITQQGFDGEIAWSKDPIHGLRTLEGLEAEQAKRLASPFMYADWKTTYDRVVTVAREEVDGKVRFKLEGTTPLGDIDTIWCDEATKLCDGFAMSLATPEGPVKSTVTMSDYRDVGGYQLPWVSEGDLALTKVKTVTTQVDVNPLVDTKLFAVPGAAEAVPTDPTAADDVPPGPPPSPSPGDDVPVTDTAVDPAEKRRPQDGDAKPPM